MKTDIELIGMLYKTARESLTPMCEVAEELEVAPETISRWKKTGILSRQNRNKIAIWLAAHGIRLEEKTVDCSIENCPAKAPVDRLLQYLLESWNDLSSDAKGKIVSIVDDDKKSTDSKVS